MTADDNRAKAEALSRHAAEVVRLGAITLKTNEDMSAWDEAVDGLIDCAPFIATALAATRSEGAAEGYARGIEAAAKVVTGPYLSSKIRALLPSPAPTTSASEAPPFHQHRYARIARADAPPAYCLDCGCKEAE